VKKAATTSSAPKPVSFAPPSAGASASSASSGPPVMIHPGKAATLASSAPPSAALHPGQAITPTGDSVSKSDYSAKLKVLIRQLEVDTIAPDVAVRQLWSSLSNTDRVRFTSEFPQFMHFVIGLPGAPVPKSASRSGPAPAAKSSAAPSDEQRKYNEALWADRVTFHGATLRINMRSMQLTDAMFEHWCAWAPAVFEPLAKASNAPLINAELDFSDNALEDKSLRLLADLLRRCNLHCASLNLDSNRFTEEACNICSEIIASFQLPLLELRLEHNRVRDPSMILQFANAVQDSGMYPIYREDHGQYTPLVLRLAQNVIEQPLSILQRLCNFLGAEPCLAQDRRYWDSKLQCPAMQFPAFEQQSHDVAI